MNINELNHISVSDSESFFNNVDNLLNRDGYRWIIHIGWMEGELSYYFIHPERRAPIVLRVTDLNETYSWPSLSHLFRALEACEQTITKAGGPQFQKGSWMPRYLWRENSALPPLRSEVLGEDFKRPVGLSESDRKWFHTIGISDVFSGHFSLHLEGSSSVVTRSKMVRGYYETKWCERAVDLNWRQLLNQTDNVSPGTPYFTNLALVESLEDHLGIELPERASAIRMILCELSRIYDHIQSMHTLFLLQGVSSWEREFLQMGMHTYQLLKRYARSEWTGHLNIIGGVYYDLPDDWKNQLLSFLSVIIKNLDGAKQTIERSPGLISMLSGINMGLKEVMNHTLTGPLARACGLRRDMRKLHSRYFYHEVDFDIPLGINSTFYDVVLVKLEEMRQSVSILAQLLDGLPFDGIQNPEYSLYWNPPEFSLLEESEREGIVAELKSGLKIGKGHSMSVVETARGELSFMWQSNSGTRPDHISIVSPSRHSSYFIEKRAQGLRVSEVYAMCSLAHIAPEEMDL